MTSNIRDEEAYLNGISLEELMASITIEDVLSFLQSLGVQDIQVHPSYLVLPTICHNPIDEAESMKLYWYQNNKIFYCYTECACGFSIFELYRKFMAINYEPVSMEEAIDYVKRFCKNITRITPQRRTTILTDFDRYYIDKKVVELPPYDKCVLDCFSPYHHPIWLNEGIGEAAMNKFNVRFQLRENRIVIPHYDINGNLVGIRQRALEAEDVKYGKYRPICVGDQIYSHELHFNLYGIYEHQAAIRKYKRAIIVESEKSVLLDETYYGENSIAVAVCGSQINKYQINLLTQELGVCEIVIALDKEYVNIRDKKAITYRRKLKSICEKYKNYAAFSYIYDEKNLLEEKDSPYDKGKEVFEKLYKERKRL